MTGGEKKKVRRQEKDIVNVFHIHPSWNVSGWPIECFELRFPVISAPLILTEVYLLSILILSL